MPSAIRHDEELRDQGLVTILVEAQGNDARTVASFVWRTFPSNHCFTSAGGHVPIPPSRGIPHGAVIGVDGTILWAGNPLSEPKKVQAFVEQELEKVKKGWGDTPGARKVRASLYGKGDLGGAMALAEELTQGDELAMLQKEIDARWQSSVRAIATLKQQGRQVRAQQRAQQLLKAAGERAEWVTIAKAEVAAFDEPEAKALLDLDKKIEKAEKQLRDKKDEQAEKALAALTKNLADSPVATRARELLEALRTKVE